MRGYTKMGSRGRMLGQAHWNMPDEYNCVDINNGIKVLEYKGNNKNQNKLPDISHTKGTMYISKDRQGQFNQLRIYDYSGRPVIDIDYGVHKQFSNEKTLHVHKLKGSAKHGQNTHLYTMKDHKKYGKYLKGLIKNEWISKR